MYAISPPCLLSLSPLTPFSLFPSLPLPFPPLPSPSLPFCSLPLPFFPPSPFKGGVRFR